MQKKWVALLALAVGVRAAGAATTYPVTVLTTDTGGGPKTDANLVNGWGISFNPNGVPWVADNGTGFSTLYGSDGTPNALVVTILPPMGSPQGTTATPTGVVFNALGGFNVTNGTTSGPSAFLFATEDGTINGWAPSVDGTHALQAINGSANSDVYKGLWTGTVTSGPQAGNYLYVADFRHATVKTFTSTFAPVASGFGFVDPNLPAGYAPFNIRTIGSSVYVAYAVQDGAKHDEVAAAGNGLIDVFDTSGNFVKRLTTGGALECALGMALAPSNFGDFSNDLIVGNFGDGSIDAFNPTTGAFLGVLDSAASTPLSIDGLWGLDFGNGNPGFATNSLFFAAGPNDEGNGAFGRIDAVPEPASLFGLALGAGLLLRRRR